MVSGKMGVVDLSNDAVNARNIFNKITEYFALSRLSRGFAAFWTAETRGGARKARDAGTA